MTQWKPDLEHEPDVVWNTDLGAYDQVIALTQYMVNESFKNMWERMEGEPDHPLRSFKVESKRYGSINAQLDAPLVMFNVESSNFTELVYIIRFLSGVGHLYMDENDDDPTETEMEGFTYAFKVDIGTISEPPTSGKYAEITGQLPQAGGPGDYSISRLLIDFTKAKLSNPVEMASNFTIPGWNNRASLRTGVECLMKFHLNVVKDANPDGNGSTLGFVATNNNTALVNSHAPTFVPTSCSFQTYPYFNRKAIGEAIGKGQNGLTETSRFNYFCYREMTDNSLPPTDTNLVNLPIRGIWTTDKLDVHGAPVDHGTFMISRSNFWENYLLPLLKKHSGLMEVICGRPKVWVAIDGLGLNWSWSCGWSIGAKQDRVYDWMESGKNSWYYSSFEGDNPDKRERLTDEQINGYFAEDTSGIIAHSYCRSRTKSWCQTEVSFRPGSNTFTMKGESGLHFWLQLDDWKSLVETDDLKYTCKWQIDFTMISVKDGGLEISVKAQEPKLEEDPNNRFELASYGKGSLKPVLEWAKSYFQESLKNISSLESNLTKAFKNQNKFFFPGSGSYFFQYPTFNHNGDMFCRISFNAAQAAPSRANPKVTAANLPKNPPTELKGNRTDEETVKKEAEGKAKREMEEKDKKESATTETSATAPSTT